VWVIYLVHLFPYLKMQGLIDAVNERTLTLDKLKAMTAICSVDLDMIAILSDTKAETITAIGVINQKTTAARIILVKNSKVGDIIELGGLLGSAPVMAVNQKASDAFIKRGGHIPAPIHSFKTI
jgi:uncharacterized protein (UPF0210 family)